MDGKAPLATGEDDDDEVPGRNLHLWVNYRILARNNKKSLYCRKVLWGRGEENKVKDRKGRHEPHFFRMEKIMQ